MEGIRDRRKSSPHPRILRPRQLTIPLRFEDRQGVQDSDKAARSEGSSSVLDDRSSMIEARVRKCRQSVVYGNAMPMKFDAARATATFEKLGDPAFCGPDGEAPHRGLRRRRVGTDGLERRAARGEGLAVSAARRAVDRVAWLWGFDHGRFLRHRSAKNSLCQFLAVLIDFLLGFKWVDALASNRSGQAGGSPAGDGAALSSRLAGGESSPPVRVVFQAVLGGLDTGFLSIVPRTAILFLDHCCICGLLSVRILTTLSSMSAPVDIFGYRWSSIDLGHDCCSSGS